MKIALLLIVLLTTAGCVEILALGASVIMGSVGIYQRHEDRDTQKDQTAEIKALREEIARLRQKWSAPSPVAP